MRPNVEPTVAARPAAAADDAERTRILLEATTAFLACNDVVDLGRALDEAILRLFAPDKSSVSVRDRSGRIRRLAADGHTAEELEQLDEALGRGAGPLERVLTGHDLWSTDTGQEDFRERVAAYDGRAGFAVSIRTPDAVIGVCAGIYLEDRTFDDAFRATARSLAAQVGLMIHLFASRDDAGRALEETERQRRRSDILLELSSALSATQDPTEIAQLVSAFLRRASGAPFAMVGRRVPGIDRFTIAATDGLGDDQVARIDAALQRRDRPSLRDLLNGLPTARRGEPAVGTGMGIGQAMGAPIIVDGRTEGFLAIGAPSVEDVASTEWPELLGAFAALTATAVARADAVAALATQRDVLASQVDERTRSLRSAMDELRVASDAKTDFLANVSHELRTPLTAILGFAEIIGAGLDGPLTPAQARDMATIQNSSQHLLELIDDLIDIAAIEAGRIQLAVEPVRLDAIVAEAVETVRPLARERGIELTVDGRLDSDLPADRARLRDIVLNLLSNPVTFTPSGGSVRLQIGMQAAADVFGHALGGEAVAELPVATVAIRDSGIGIAAGDQDRIFEKFVRVADPSVPGTGLGLSIARELARLHGGDVRVESELGQGSTFLLRLPLEGPG